MAYVIVAGIEPAKDVLDEIARELEQSGHQVVVHLGNSGLAERIDWSRAELLVTILCGCGEHDIQAATGLRSIVSPLIGFDWIDVRAASDAGILVVNGPVEENQQSMAEATIMLALVALYELHATERSLRTPDANPLPQRRMLRNKTVGLIGFGAIAQAIVSRLATWGVEVQSFSRYTQHHPGVAFVALDHLLATSDVIMVLTSLDDESRHLLDRHRLNSVKPGAVLINTSRGGVIEEAALIDALKSGRIAKAMLDVFEVEPLPDDSPLRVLPNVVLMPHAIGHTQETREAIPRLAARHALELLAGQVPAACRNAHVAALWQAKGERHAVSTTV